MRITHVVRQYVPYHGGLETSVHNLARQQVKLGHSVKVVTLARRLHGQSEQLPRIDKIDGVDIIRLRHFGSSRYPLAPQAILHTVRTDILHIHAIDFFFDFFAIVGPLIRRRMVVSTHGGFFHTERLATLKKVYFKTVTRNSMRSYGACVCISEGDYSNFTSLRENGLVVVHNPIDLEKFAPQARSEMATRTLVSIARFSSNKCPEKLLDLLASLPREEVWRLCFIGVEGDISAAQLRQSAIERGLADQVEIHVGLPEHEVRQILENCDAFISSSSYEGFGVAAIEAMSAGLPCILSDIPSYRKIVGESGQGLIVDFDSPTDAAILIRRWWDERGADVKSVETRREYTQQFGPASVTDKVLDIYHNVLGTEVRMIAGMPVSVFRRNDAVVHLDRIEAGQQRIVAFANTNFATTATRDTLARDKRLLFFNDGIGMDIASLILYRAPFPENLNGTDFTSHFLATSRRNWRVYLLGATPDVISRASLALKTRFPNHEIVGFRDGYFQASESTRIASEIKNSGADLLLCGMGNPVQEEWLLRHGAETGCTLLMAVGAYFDFVSGDKPRAPAMVQKARLEWLFRLCIEPRRLFRRYTLGLSHFLWMVGRQFLRGERA